MQLVAPVVVHVYVPPGVEATAYPVIAAPPLNGAAQLTSVALLPGVAVAAVGAFGTVCSVAFAKTAELMSPAVSKAFTE